LLSFAQAHAEVDPNGAYFGGWTNYTYVYEDDVSAPITVLTWASAASGMLRFIEGYLMSLT
jgi:hypothetical protein